MNCKKCNTQNEEEALFCRNCGIAIHETNVSDVRFKTSDMLLIIFLGITLILVIAQFYIQKYVENWIQSPVKILQAGLWIFQNVSFILIPLCIRDKTLKIVGLIITFLVVSYWIYKNVEFMTSINY